MKVDYEFLKIANEKKIRIDFLKEQKQSLIQSMKNFDNFDDNFLKAGCGNGTINYHISLQTRIKNHNDFEKKIRENYFDFAENMIKIIDDEINNLLEI